MVIDNILKDCLVFSIVFIPPLVIFIRFWNESQKSTWMLIVISILYIIISPFTQNLLPFILVLIDISYIKKSYNSSVFNLKSFKIGSAIKYSVCSYAIVIAMAILSDIIFSFYRFNLKEQDVVSWMSGLSMWKFLAAVPIAVVFAPVVEEFVFRWFLFEKVFSARLNIVISGILSSLIFALVHFNLGSFPIIFCIGIFNCYLIHKKGFWYSVFNHAIFNFVSTFVIFTAKLGAKI